VADATKNRVSDRALIRPAVIVAGHGLLHCSIVSPAAPTSKARFLEFRSTYLAARSGSGLGAICLEGR
jgi:hypothetical protein